MPEAVVPRRRPAALAPRPAHYRLKASDGQIRRVQHLWEESELTKREIAKAVLLPLQTISDLIDQHVEWTPRARLSHLDGATRLLALLIEIAKRGEVCPSDEKLGHQLGITKMYCQQMIKRLIVNRKIRTKKILLTEGILSSSHRIVFIGDLHTKVPTIRDAWFSTKREPGSDQAQRLEAAKNHVRRQGYMVCNADVVFPGRAGIMVNSTHYSVEDFMSYALRRGFGG